MIKHRNTSAIRTYFSAVNGTKGNKYRFVPLSEKALKYMSNHFKEGKLKVYFIEEHNVVLYSMASLNAILKEGSKFAVIR